MPDDDEDAVRHGEGGLVRAASTGDLAVLGVEVGAAGAGGGAGALDERPTQPAVARWGGDLAPLAGGLVVAGAHASPGGQMSGAGESGHVPTGLRKDDLDARPVQARHAHESVDGGLVDP